MLPWTPPASLSMQQQNQNQQGVQQQNELHSIGMQHQQPQHQQQGGMQFGGQQQQQQQHPQQQQQSQMQQQQQANDLNAANQQGQQPPLMLSQVLHYLQTEWRRYERERNEWEIERGEMRARIALLEGTRKGTENLKSDLQLRVKMLEYALRVERNKNAATANHQNALLKEKDAQAAQKVADDKEKEREGKEGSESSKDGSKKDAAEEKEKEKPSAIPSEKKKLMKEQSGADDIASGRASPAPAATSEDGAAAAIPDVIVSTASQPSSATSANPPVQTGKGVQRVASTASLASLPNGQASSIISAPGSTMNLGPLSWNPSLGRDPRSRAKSREYLKQCLQEINYLTSATALNPLPDRTPAGLPRPRKQIIDMPSQVSVNGGIQGDSLLPGSIPQAHSSGGNTVIPLPQTAGSALPPALGTVSQLNITNATSESPSAPGQSEIAGSNPSSNNTDNNANQAAGAMNGQMQPSQSLPASDIAVPRTAADVFSSAPENEEGAESATMTSDAASRLTAIFRPESSEEWKKAIQKAGQQQQQGIIEPASEGAGAGQTLSMKEAQVQYGQEKDASAFATNGTSARGRSDTVQSTASPPTALTAGNDSDKDHKVWKPRRTLRAHLDAARCIAFDRSERSEDVSLASGGDDCTVKLWRLPLHSLTATNRSQHLPDSEPAVTYRGHTGPVTSLCLTSTSATNRIYSSSLDSTILGWQMPPRDRDTYAPFDSNLNVTRLEGHTDGVWDVCLIATAGPSNSHNGLSSGADVNKEILASASADGTVKIWDVSPQRDDLGAASGGALKLSWTAAGTEGSEENAFKPIPTSLALCQTDMTKLAVAYQDGIIRIFDTETGKLVLSLPTGDNSGVESAQINRIVSHPTLPMLITASEDNYIRLFDLKSGTCTHSLLGHIDAVTSLDVDPSGLTIASASHDCTVRFWDLLQTRSCIQEVANSHRTKGDEGVLDVKYHPTLPFVASSGADGGVRVYG